MVHNLTEQIDGFALAAERSRRGVKQYELAAALGVSAPTLSKWENGKEIPNDPDTGEQFGHVDYLDALDRVIEKRS